MTLHLSILFIQFGEAETCTFKINTSSRNQNILSLYLIIPGIESVLVLLMSLGKVAS